jgi:hypothetical protein
MAASWVARITGISHWHPAPLPTPFFHRVSLYSIG